MAIHESLYFEYDGIKSIDFGIINVTVTDSSMKEEKLSNREIKEVSVRGRNRPYFQDIIRNPISIQVSFAFEETWDNEKIRKVCRWLTEQDYYKPLIFSSDNERIFYALVVNEPVLIHNCLKQGYLNLEFRCSDSYTYSPVYTRTTSWDESSSMVKVDTFSSGQYHQTEIDSEGNLTVTAIPKIWRDFPPNVRWADLM
ncbi:phage tail protein [Paenibacillaceae bacterium]|nr:phage tail protein [Paenibacillaceae bacterium]